MGLGTADKRDAPGTVNPNEMEDQGLHSPVGVETHAGVSFHFMGDGHVGQGIEAFVEAVEFRHGNRAADTSYNFV